MKHFSDETSGNFPGQSIRYVMSDKKEEKEKKEEERMIDSMRKLFLADDDFDLYIKEMIQKNRRQKCKNKKK